MLEAYSYINFVHKNMGLKFALAKWVVPSLVVCFPTECTALNLNICPSVSILLRGLETSW